MSSTSALSFEFNYSSVNFWLVQGGPTEVDSSEVFLLYFKSTFLFLFIKKVSVLYQSVFIRKPLLHNIPKHNICTFYLITLEI